MVSAFIFISSFALDVSRYGPVERDTVRFFFLIAHTRHTLDFIFVITRFCSFILGNFALLFEKIVVPHDYRNTSALHTANECTEEIARNGEIGFAQSAYRVVLREIGRTIYFRKYRG